MPLVGQKTVRDMAWRIAMAEQRCAALERKLVRAQHELAHVGTRIDRMAKLIEAVVGLGCDGSETSVANAKVKLATMLRGAHEHRVTIRDARERTPLAPRRPST